MWFGEIPEGQGEITRILTKVDVLLVVGTSSLVRRLLLHSSGSKSDCLLPQVHPAASYATTVKKNGGTVAVFNMAPSQGDDKADFVFYGPCEKTIPALLERAGQMVAGELEVTAPQM